MPGCEHLDHGKQFQSWIDIDLNSCVRANEATCPGIAFQHCRGAKSEWILLVTGVAASEGTGLAPQGLATDKNMCADLGVLLKARSPIGNDVIGMIMRR